MKDTLTILKDAYALIMDKENWITKFAARDAVGRVVNPWTPEAAKFCAAGAVWKASGCQFGDPRLRNIDEAFNALAEAAEATPDGIAYVNDGPDGHARVCEAYRKAIADLTPIEEKTPDDELVLAF